MIPDPKLLNSSV